MIILNFKVNFEDFLRYLNIVINENEKALLSFKFLDIGNKGKITKYDIEKLTYEVCILWKLLSGTKAFP